MVEQKTSPKWDMLDNNLLFTITGKSAVLFKVDFTKELGLSKSGKSNMIATSKGAKSITLPDGSVLKVNVNIYKPVV